ncbi:hypothetical protein GCM10011316_10540 [Roseibium aquae]|uniref:Uncharacterized protein n=1 Tax=Roseibium aquae TaxID=1323746 RepID=A0A916TEA9_9HYPH|nr:hypothetical protein [Roseibium aquae]GGB40366.1 hypothetical protein GCM10011316_10540 [Roseibium aquae]
MARSLFEPVPHTEHQTFWTRLRGQPDPDSRPTLTTIAYDTAGLAERAGRLDARGRQSLLAAAFGTQLDRD